MIKHKSKHLKIFENFAEALRGPRGTLGGPGKLFVFFCFFDFLKHVFFYHGLYVYLSGIQTYS